MEQFIVFEVPQETLKKRDISRIVNTLTVENVSPEILKSYRGQCMITFEGFAQDEREIWEIEDARIYMQKVDSRIPYLVYFIVPDPRAGQLMLWLACLLQSRRKSGGAELILEESCGIVTSRLTAMKAFCEQIGEAYVPVVGTILMGLPADLTALVRLRLNL